MLVIFDVDGTLIGGETFDWASFDASFESSAGFALSQAFWDSLEEVTARSVVHAALAKRPPDERERLENLVRLGYLERLKEAHRTHPEAFRPTTGASELLSWLRSTPGVSVAVATGDWQSSSSFKLAAAGLDLAGLPVATCSDCHTRAEIICLAANRAGRPVTEAIYVGDGRWDYRACRQLNIPFIGTGCRKDELRAAGAKNLLPDLSPGPFWEMLKTLGNGSNPIAAAPASLPGAG
jgi:phosphoglycolate phosphatase-like HAD superfamily hydrolase